MRSLFEIIAVTLLSFIGLVVGALTGWPPMSPILGSLFGVGGATWFLYREGSTWQELGFLKPMPITHAFGYAIAILALVFITTNYLVTPIVSALGAPPTDVGILLQLIEGNWTNYLVFLIPVSWGSAAIGEELIARGFLLNRFTRLGGQHIGVILQAAFFAGAHFYQGLTGVVNIFVLAIIFGYAFYRCGRNLWPLILAHGITDTLGMTFLFLGRTDLITGS